MNWQDILKDSKLDSVQETSMSIKPEEQNSNCLRTLKTLIRELKRWARKYDGRIPKEKNIGNYTQFHLKSEVSEQTACNLIKHYLTAEEDDWEAYTDDNIINQWAFHFEYLDEFEQGNLYFSLIAEDHFGEVPFEEEIHIRVGFTFDTKELTNEAGEEFVGILKRVLGADRRS